MKIEQYHDIGYQNPWKIFKQGILPIGLAVAYREKHGYDPLKACRLYFWLNYIRGSAWWLLVMAMTTPLLYAPIIGQREMNGSDSFFGIPVVRHVAMFVVGLSLFLIFTQKAYKQSRKRMLNFQDATYSFVIAFSSMFEDGSPVIKPSMGKDELFEIVSRSMIRTAQAIVEGEIIGLDTKAERYQLGKKSSIANTFGLGREWSTYFKEAQKVIDPYKLFMWEI